MSRSPAATTLPVSTSTSATVASRGRVNCRLHLHRFERQKPLSLLHFVSLAHLDPGHFARHGCGDVMGIVGLGLGMLVQVALDRMIGDTHRLRLAVQFEKHGTGAVFVNVARR